MANEELVLPLFKYWQQEKMDKKFSINVEPRPSASLPTVDITPAPESAQRPSSSISGAADKLVSCSLLIGLICLPAPATELQARLRRLRYR
jgi:hypothetical protein